jgi:type 1 glutamine amidotransferase
MELHQKQSFESHIVILEGTMKKMKLAVFVRMAVLTGLLVAGITRADAQKKLLVVTATRGFRHSSIPTAEKILKEMGEKSGVFTVDYVRGGADGKDDAEFKEKMTPEALKQYDGVIFANTTGDLPIPDKEAFIAWIKSGKAFIGTHSASDTFHGFPEFIDLIGSEFLTHGAQVKVDCLNQDPTHPATKDMPAVYSVLDEIYQMKNFHRDRVHGLLTLDKHPNAGTPGDYPIAWCKQVGFGKVFYTSLGHREDVWESAIYQKHLLGGIKWALGLEHGDTVPQSTQERLSAEELQDGFKPLFNGVDFNGWHLRHTDGPVSWSVQNGMLANNIGKEHGTDLVTNDKFRDFTVRYEYMIPKGANSGFYLRGRYEIQIFDDFDKKEAVPTGNGAIYNTKAASEFVSRAPGQWQQVEATIKGNKISVTLNGVKIQDNVEVTKATGSELDTDLDQPGAIFLQGDHGSVAFRNIRIKNLN